MCVSPETDLFLGSKSLSAHSTIIFGNSGLKVKAYFSIAAVSRYEQIICMSGLKYYISCLDLKVPILSASVAQCESSECSSAQLKRLWRRQETNK